MSTKPSKGEEVPYHIEVTKDEETGVETSRIVFETKHDSTTVQRPEKDSGKAEIKE